MQVRRLARLSGGGEPSRRFLREWFAYAKTVGLTRPSEPGFSFDAQSIAAEADDHLGQILRESGERGLLKALLTTRTGLARASTAPAYNLTSTSKSSAPLMYAGDRMGILGHPAWLSAYAQPERTDPTARGLFVRRELLCGNVPPANIDELPQLPKDPKLTMRERLSVHVANPTCNACHGLFDAIGLGLEGFDRFGRQREVEAGKPVNRAGVLSGAGAQDGPFEGLEGLAGRLVEAPAVTECLATRAFEWFRARAPAEADRCTISAAAQAFRAGGEDLGALLATLFANPTFVERARPR
jgi:hypothetical protein